jgi:hypothetical protein
MVQIGNSLHKILTKNSFFVVGRRAGKGSNEGGGGGCRPKQCLEPLERCREGLLLRWSRVQRPPHPGQKLSCWFHLKWNLGRDRGFGLFGLPRTSLALETPRGMLHAWSVSCWVHARPQPLWSKRILALFCAEGLKRTFVHVTSSGGCALDFSWTCLTESMCVRAVPNVPFWARVSEAESGNLRFSGSSFA